MPLSEDIKKRINNAWADGFPCLLATTGKDGPNISPKGSMLVFDDKHLAYWERSKKQALQNVGQDKRVCVMYANFPAQLKKEMPAGFLRFWGSVELFEKGPTHDAIFAKLTKREQEHVGADTGIGVLVKIDRALDIHGHSII
jgi:hypothetical protein